MSKAKRTLDRRKTLEEELQEIYEQRQHRKSTFSVATQIVFLEMDLHDNKQLEEKASVFSRDGLLAPMSNNAACRFGPNDLATPRLISSSRSRRRSANSSKKSEVTHLQLKDIRRIEYVFNSAPQPLVFIRRHIVVISFTPIRIIVLADRLLLFVDAGLIDCALKDLFVDQLKTSMEVYQHHQELRRKNPHKNFNFLSFELSVYEAVFGAVIEIQKQHLRELEIRVKRVVQILKDFSIVPVEVNEKVRGFMDAVLEFTEKTNSQRRVIDELLDDKNSMALMRLSALREDPSLYSVPLRPEIVNLAEETETLLESYLMDYNAILSRLRLMKLQLEGAESMVYYRLEHGFNTMLIGETVIAVLTAALIVGIFLGGLGGMNLAHNGLENHTRLVFQIFVFLTTLLIVMFCVFAVVIMQRYGILPKAYNSRVDTL